MILVTDINGRKHYIAPANIASVVEAGPSSQWHGIKAILHLFDGGVIECQESAHAIAAALKK